MFRPYFLTHHLLVHVLRGCVHSIKVMTHTLSCDSGDSDSGFLPSQSQVLGISIAKRRYSMPDKDAGAVLKIDRPMKDRRCLASSAKPVPLTCETTFCVVKQGVEAAAG